MTVTIKSVNNAARWLDPATREAAAAPGVVTAVALAAAKASGDNLFLMYRLPNAPVHQISVSHAGCTTAFEYVHSYRTLELAQLPAAPVASLDDYLPNSDKAADDRNVNAFGVASGMTRAQVSAWDDYLLIVIAGGDITTAPDEDALVTIESLHPGVDSYSEAAE
jgi:hypothetical protein